MACHLGRIYNGRNDRRAGSQCGHRENPVLSLFDLVPGLSYQPVPVTYMTKRDQRQRPDGTSFPVKISGARISPL